MSTNRDNIDVSTSESAVTTTRSAGDHLDDDAVIGLTGDDGAVLDLRTSAKRRADLRPSPDLEPRAGIPTVVQRVAACGLLLLAAPVIAAIALVIRLTSPGPVLYASQRLGQQRRRFSAWKLRSMYCDADQRLDDLLASDPSLETEWLENFKLEDDPRVTPLGRVLRRTSLDELPQLWNVVQGEMLLIGPRPKLPEEAGQCGEHLDSILSVPPGLSGLWQVSGRSDVSYTERIALDLEYLETRSVSVDLRIAAMTAEQLLLGRSAAH